MLLVASTLQFLPCLISLFHQLIVNHQRGPGISSSIQLLLISQFLTFPVGETLVFDILIENNGKYF